MKQLTLLLALLIFQSLVNAQIQADEKKNGSTQPSWKELENTWICYRYGGFSIKRITRGKETYEQYWAGGDLRFSHKSDMKVFRQAGVNFYTKTNHSPISPKKQSGISGDYTGIYKVANGRFYEISRGLFADTQGKPQVNEFRPIDAPIEKWLAAARGNDIEAITNMFAKGALPDATAPGSVTALNFAACQGHIELIRLLVKHKANLSKRSGPLGATALVSAAGAGQLQSCKTLLESGADIQETHAWFNMSPLHETAFQGRPEVMNFLIGKGADLNALNKGGWTPLHIAVSRSTNKKGEPRDAQIECVRILVAKGANKDIKDPKGRTPLALARELKLASITGILSE